MSRSGVGVDAGMKRTSPPRSSKAPSVTRACRCTNAGEELCDASCQLHGIEPWAYLRDLFCLLPSWPKSRALELAPAFWKQTLEQRLVLLGIDGGLRRGEILGLQWSDLNFARMNMTIRHNIVQGKLDVPKGRTEEEVGMTRRLAVALNAIRHQRGPFVLATDSGEHFKNHSIVRWMRKLVERANLTWHGTHILRKTCGTRIADGGGGVAAVATHLRHKNLQTASRYIDRRGAGSRALNALES